jgi:hypothetical protein
MSAHAIRVAGAWACMLMACMASCAPEPAPPQPLPFNHALHAGTHAIACTECHAGAERSARAGLPALGHCLRCHMKPQSPGDNAREQRVRDRAAQGGRFRWIQVNRNEGHVYFSHAAHVSLAGMECSECHGDVRAWTESPRLPDPYLHSMKACMNCHRERGAPNQCGACHR